MLLQLAKIIDSPGKSIPFETSLDLSEMEFGGSRPAQEPLKASGTVKNTAGVLVLEGTEKTVLHCVCDRCAKEFLHPMELPLHAVLVSELADETDEDPSVFLLDGESVDLDEVITTAFVLNVETKTLCDENCKGLCPQCGADLNRGPCNCRKEPDPRLAALQQLLKNRE